MSKNKLAFILFLFGVFLFYSFRLNLSPDYLNQDEVMFSLNAKSVGESGSDFYGNKYPFYFWHLDSFWATPVIVYFSSMFLKLLPLNVVSVRLPGIFLAMINIGLMMYLVKMVFKNRVLTFLSGIIFATTPAFYVNSRLLLDNIYPITFVLLWLIFLFRNKSFLAGLSLGLGVHSYHAAKIFMPLYLIFSLWKKSRLLIILGFIIPILLFIPWLKNHPDTLTNQISYAKSIDRDLGSNIISNYISYFDPAVLFTTGDKSLIHSTGNSGIFLFPLVFLLVFGMIYAFKEKDYFSKVILLGFISYPLAPAVINDPGRISRALVIIPFAVLLSVYGLKFIFESREKLLRTLFYLLSGFYLILFMVFLLDYLGDYRVRSRATFNNNVGGAFESVLKSTQIRPVEKIYIDKNIFQAKFYWEFYKTKLNISPTETIFLENDEAENVVLTGGDLLVTNRKIKPTEESELIEIIRELDGAETYFVYWNDEK